ncbi:MAG: hypothetical protein AAF378_25560 [Cyanobacteria bacterium P01_A01_bin.84]
MSTNFLDIDNEKTNTKECPQTVISQIPEREKIKHTLVGSTKAVMGTIRVLHQLGYAQIGDWSPLLPTENPGEVISILIRSISVQ